MQGQLPHRPAITRVILEERHLSYTSVRSCRTLQEEKWRPHIARLCMYWCLMLIGCVCTYSASAVVRVGIDVIVHTFVRIVHARLGQIRNLRTFEGQRGLQVMRRCRRIFLRGNKSSEATLSGWTLLLEHVLAVSGGAESLTASSRAVERPNLWIAVHREATVAHFTRPALPSWQLPNRSACAVQGARLASRETPHAPVGDSAGVQVKGADEAHRYYPSYLRRTAPAHC